MKWIDPDQDRNRWRAHVSAVISLRVSMYARNFLTIAGPVRFLRRTLFFS